MFSETLKELRKTHGKISQTKLAEQIGVSQQAVGLWETGKTMPDYPVMIQLADFFHVSIDYLLGHEVAQPESSTPTSEPTDIKQLIAQELPNMDSETAATVGQFIQFLKVQKGLSAKTADQKV